MVNDVRKINVDAYNYRYPMRYLCVRICTYVYKRRTMETIVSINIGSVPDAYSARTIYVSKHVPWKAPFTQLIADEIVVTQKHVLKSFRLTNKLLMHDILRYLVNEY